MCRIEPAGGTDTARPLQLLHTHTQDRAQVLSRTLKAKKNRQHTRGSQGPQLLLQGGTATLLTDHTGRHAVSMQCAAQKLCTLPHQRRPWLSSFALALPSPPPAAPLHAAAVSAAAPTRTRPAAATVTGAAAVQAKL